MRTDRRWTVGGALVAVALLASSWFLLIGPQFDQTSSLQARSEAAHQRLWTLQRRLVELRKQSTRLEEYKTQLAQDRQALPTTAALADFLRELEDAGKATDVSVNGLVVGAPAAVPGISATIYSLPITMIAVGSSEHLSGFLDQLQQVQPRAVLITSINAVPDGTGKSLLDTVALTMAMQVFVAPASSAEAAPPAGAGDAIGDATGDAGAAGTTR